MNIQTIVMCVVALILGMLLAHMLKGVCGCKVVEGVEDDWGARRVFSDDNTCADKCSQYLNPCFSPSCDSLRLNLKANYSL